MSQFNTTWEYNGHQFEIDLQDAETAEKYEAAFEEMGKEEKLLKKDGKPSDFIKGYYKLFVDLYDRIFGEGNGVKILGDKANARICNEAYDSFLTFVACQREQNDAFKNSIITKYSPNRAQRRASAKKS